MFLVNKLFQMLKNPAFGTLSLCLSPYLCLSVCLSFSLFSLLVSAQLRIMSFCFQLKTCIILHIPHRWLIYWLERSTCDAENRTVKSCQKTHPCNRCRQHQLTVYM